MGELSARSIEHFLPVRNTGSGWKPSCRCGLPIQFRWVIRSEHDGADFWFQSPNLHPYGCYIIQWQNRYCSSCKWRLQLFANFRHRGSFTTPHSYSDNSCRSAIEGSKRTSVYHWPWHRWSSDHGSAGILRHQWNGSSGTTSEPQYFEPWWS